MQKTDEQYYQKVTKGCNPCKKGIGELSKAIFDSYVITFD